MAVASKTWTTSYGRYVRLRITAQEVEVDTPNNRSKVRVTGQVYYDGGTSAHNAYPQTYTVTVNGVQAGRQTGFTYSLSSGGTKNLTTYTSGWIAHNSNGTKTVTVRGHITDGAGDTGTISQSYALTTIARASTLSSFSMPNHLKPGTTTTFNLGISRKSSSFTHDISLRDGNTVIASWTGQATPTTRSLTATQTNTLLKRMSSSTSRTMTLRVQTKSGSTNIGGALTRTATVYVHSDVKPTVEKLSVTIEGNAHAKTNVKRFVQGISKVSGKFTRSANGGASISSSKLQIRRVSGGADLQTINTNSGTFPRVVALNGPYQARGIATDSRGRSNDTGWVNLSNFDVLAYSVPQITNFSTNRRANVATTVDITRRGTFSGLSGDNVITITVQKRISGATSWTNVVPVATTYADNFGTNLTSTGHSVASSYEFRMHIVDQFGNSAERISTVTTQRVVLDIHKNEGVGIGKIHEQGVLDVDGAIYSNGVRLDTQETLLPAGDGSKAYWESIVPGSYRLNPNLFPGQPRDWGYVTLMSTPGSASVEITGSGQTTTSDYKMSFNYQTTPEQMNDWHEIDLVVSHGTNSNGHWVRYRNGLQICWSDSINFPFSATTLWGNNMYRTVSREYVYPQSFIDTPAFSVHSIRTANNDHTRIPITGRTTNSANRTPYIYLLDPNDSASTGFHIVWSAIGRWRQL